MSKFTTQDCCYSYFSLHSNLSNATVLLPYMHAGPASYIPIFLLLCMQWCLMEIKYCVCTIWRHFPLLTTGCNKILKIDHHNGYVIHAASARRHIYKLFAGHQQILLSQNHINRLLIIYLIDTMQKHIMINSFKVKVVIYIHLTSELLTN